MSAYAFCSQVVRIPAVDHYGWRGSLVACQGVCLVAYAAAAWLNRGRLFVASQKRVWDLDTAYMGLSIAAAAAGMVTWGSWLDLAARKVQTQSAVASGDHLRIATARYPECVANAAYLFAKPISVVMYSSSQLLVALRLLDMVNIGRGLRARVMKRRLRIVTLVACALLNAPSFVGCWIAAAVYEHPLHSPLISLRLRRVRSPCCCRFLERAGLAKESSADAAKAGNLTKTFSATNARLSPAITLQLAAQAALYIICCASLVLACLVAFVRLRQLNRGLMESQRFVAQHKNKVKERVSVQHKEKPSTRSSDCGSEQAENMSQATAFPASSQATEGTRPQNDILLCF